MIEPCIYPFHQAMHAYFTRKGIENGKTFPRTRRRVGVRQTIMRGKNLKKTPVISQVTIRAFMGIPSVLYNVLYMYLNTCKRNTCNKQQYHESL